MNRLLFTLAVFAALSTFCRAAESVAAPSPRWIWMDAAQPVFERQFTVDAPVQRAVLKFAADFCQAYVSINREKALVIHPYCPTQELDVTDWMRRGDNTIAVLASPDYPSEGPSAVALSLGIVTQDGKAATVVSDGRWSARNASGPDRGRMADDLGAVRPELWGLGRRGIAVSPLENYEQWQQMKAGAPKVEPKLWAAPGFEITLVREAGPDEGSWIAMAFDPAGRLTISREDKGLLRMTINGSRKKVTRVEPIDVDLKECRGLLYAHGALYANANNTKAFCRLKIADDGKVADLEHLREWPGDVGHGRNDLALGPDGEIYSIHGDSVLPPGEPILDHTSPLRESRRGPPRKEAYLLKTDKDGKQWELICTGLRNPYGVAVHPNGDLFTYDADNEFDMGTPWYRPTRIVQMVSGADYGYRAAGGGRWPPEFVEHADNGLPTIDIGRGSPTAAMFGTDLKFPSPYREAMYALDWSYGRVLAIHLAPRGAGYRAATELFLQGKPLNVTDIAAGPDGAMWIITGGRKTQSALYRVAFTGQEPAARNLADEPHERAAREYSEKQRARRLELEAWHRPGMLHEAKTPFRQIEGRAAIAWEAMRSHDPSIVQAGMAAVEQEPRPPGGVPQLPTELFELMWMRRDAAATVEKIVDGKYLEIPTGWFGSKWYGDLNERQRFQEFMGMKGRITVNRHQPSDPSMAFHGLRMLERCLKASPETVARQRTELVAAVLKIGSSDDRSNWLGGLVGEEPKASSTPDGSKPARWVTPYGDERHLRRRTAVLLGTLLSHDLRSKGAEKEAAPTDIEKKAFARILTLLKSEVQEDRLTGLLALRNVRDGWTAEDRRLYFETLNAGTRFVGGQGMPTFLAKLREDALASLSEAEKESLADVINPKPPESEPLPPPRPIVKKWTLDELAKLVADDGAKGDAKRGATIFRDALCSRCHRAGLTGPAVGPDLTMVARRFSRRDMLQSIVTPSAAVADIYRNSEITTADGRSIVGRVVVEGDFRSEKLLVNTDPLRPTQWVEIDKKEIEEHREATTSPMPEGLLDSFKPQEIADLLAFLEGELR
jgi:putative heme-binding domain-containing protein